jgi:two-component system, NtrC family, response regulator AtoC
MSYAILIVDDEENARHNIGSFLSAKGYDVIGVATLSEATECVRRGNADIVLLDVNLPDGYGPDLLEEVTYLPIRPPIIVITAYGDVEMAVAAMKGGAHDFLQKPIQFSQLEKSIERAKEIVGMRRELAHLRQAQHPQLDFIVGKTQAMQTAMDHARRASIGQVSVLITGDTGTGKEILAHAIHMMGPRAKKAFVAINCAAIQTTVLESELFGYEAGAFTGADKRKHGLMEVADGGILFLDEISSMPLDIQAKLLRAIEEHSFFRVGATKMVHVDVQILAASNKDVLTLITDGKFRQDLYYRLKVVNVHLPPLRERKEDIPDLVGLFIRDINGRRGVNITDVTSRAMEALMDHNWPGNIRELHHTMERAVLFCDESTIDLAHLPSEILNGKI